MEGHATKIAPTPQCGRRWAENPSPSDEFLPGLLERPGVWGVFVAGAQTSSATDAIESARGGRTSYGRLRSESRPERPRSSKAPNPDAQPAPRGSLLRGEPPGPSPPGSSFEWGLLSAAARQGGSEPPHAPHRPHAQTARTTPTPTQPPRRQRPTGPPSANLRTSCPAASRVCSRSPAQTRAAVPGFRPTSRRLRPAASTV